MCPDLFSRGKYAHLLLITTHELLRQSGNTPHLSPHSPTKDFVAFYNMLSHMYCFPILYSFLLTLKREELHTLLIKLEAESRLDIKTEHIRKYE